MTSCYKWRKKMKVLAFNHACHYTEKYFRKYLKKYINKMGKMGSKYGWEEVKAFVEYCADDVEDILTECMCCNEVRVQQTYIFANSNTVHLGTWRRCLVTELAKVIFSKPEVQEAGMAEEQKRYTKVISNIVTYAIGLRKELNAAQSVAKTKLQEYWADRTPPMLIILGLIFAGKLYLDIKKAETGKWEDIVGSSLSLALTVMAFAGAFFMVYLRLPHAVDGATRQKASDYYLAAKDPLGKFLSGIIPSTCYQDQVTACFERITTTMKDVVKNKSNHAQVHVNYDSDDDGAYSESSSDADEVHSSRVSKSNEPFQAAVEEDSLVLELESQQRELQEQIAEMKAKDPPADEDV